MTVLAIIILEILFGVCTSAACLSSHLGSLQTGPQCGSQSSPLGLKDCTSTFTQHGTAHQRATLSSEHTSTQQALRQENRSLPSVDGRSGSNGVALIQRYASRLNSPWNRSHSFSTSRQVTLTPSVQVLLCRWHA